MIEAHFFGGPKDGEMLAIERPIPIYDFRLPGLSEKLPGGTVVFSSGRVLRYRRGEGKRAKFGMSVYRYEFEGY